MGDSDWWRTNENRAGFVLETRRSFEVRRGVNVAEVGAGVDGGQGDNGCVDGVSELGVG